MRVDRRRMDCGTWCAACACVCGVAVAVLVATPPLAAAPEVQAVHAGIIQDDADATERPRLRTLDELLGIGEGSLADNLELEEALGDGEPLDRLRKVQYLLEQAGDAIEAGDLSLATQRLQERASKLIDDLLADAERQQQQSSSSCQSSSSSSQQQGQRPGDATAADQTADRDGSAQPNAPERQQGSPGENDPSRGGRREGESPPERIDGDASGALEATEIEWGSLPPRVREALRQGLRERMSTPYRAWTEAYFRRIAEESRR